MKRIDFISILRILSMLSILMFHSLCFYAGVWWYLQAETVPIWRVIAMPIVKIGLSTFFLIAGFLFGFLYIERNKYRVLTTFFLNKTRRIVLPYIIWSGFMIISFPFIPWSDCLIGTAHLWFLLTLFELFIIIILPIKLLSIHTNIYIDSIILATSLILLYIWQNQIEHHFVLSIENTLYFLPAFLTGFYCAKYRLHTWYYRKAAFFLLSFCIIILIALSYYSTKENTSLVIDIAVRLLSCIAAINTLIMTNSIIIPEESKLLVQNLDNNSMGIYIFNQIIVFVILLIPFLRHFLEVHYMVGPFIIFIVSFFIPWGLAILFNRTKYLSWMIGSSIAKQH